MDVDLRDIPGDWPCQGAATAVVIALQSLPDCIEEVVIGILDECHGLQGLSKRPEVSCAVILAESLKVGDISIFAAMDDLIWHITDVGDEDGLAADLAEELHASYSDDRPMA